MKKELLDKLKKRLEEEKKRLEQTLDEIATKDKEIKDNYEAKFVDFGEKVYDPSSEASEVSEYDTKLSLEANLEVKLKDVNQALRRIKKGTYGVCENCKKEIEQERLEALPTAKLCLQCRQKKK